MPLFKGTEIRMPTRRHRPHRQSPHQLELKPPTWGGRREGAGHPRTGRTKVAHRQRPRVTRHTPVHATVRLRDDLPSLRRGQIFRMVRKTIGEVCDQEAFRICQFSVQQTHVHLICEADDETGLARGIQDLTARLARRLNRHLGRRGRVLADRYHARPLESPREVKTALRYVLLNGRRHAPQHGRRIGPDWLDPCSSAASFDGWKEALPWQEPWMRELAAQEPATAPARSWLLSTGWKERHGALSLAETPGPPPPVS
jgi:putative transposase